MLETEEDADEVKENEKSASAKLCSRPELDHCKKRVVIPFVIPLESRAARQSQSGMGGFGRPRDASFVINQGSTLLPKDRKGETELSLFAQQNRFDSQSGTSGFGAYRSNVSKPLGGKDVDPKLLKLSDGIIPKQAGSNKLPSMVGQVPIGARRNQVSQVRYKFETAGKPHHPKYRNTLGVIPKLFDPRQSPGSDATGTGAGMYGLKPGRQVTTKITGGYSMTDDEHAACQKLTPWIFSPLYQSQAGMGGFNKRRDVVNHAVVKL